MRCLAALLALALAVFSAPLSARAQASQLLTRTLQDRPAVVIAAFGTSTAAEATYGVFEARLREALPELEIRWAFTSEVIRERVNERRRAQGRTDLLPSLQQALADLEASGYTKAVVQPLHIFPGQEYEEAVSIASRFPGLRVEIGETLLHRWENVRHVVEAVSRDFLPPEEGCNVLVSHGTPLTASPANIAYLGLERHLTRTHPNAFLGVVEGIFAAEDALDSAAACPGSRVRFLPFMYVGGEHLMRDVMGEGASWKKVVEAAGKAAEATTVEHQGQTLYKGLGFHPEVNDLFLDSLRRALARL